MARTPLSINWTLKQVRGIIRVLANELAGNKIVDAAIDDMIHIALSMVVSQLGEVCENDYIEKETVTETSGGSGEIDVKALPINKIVKLVDATNGLCVPVNSSEFEGAKLIDQNKKSIIWTRRGNSIDIWKGANVTAYGTLSLFYKTRPVKADADATKIDISDDYVDIVITRTKMLVYETLAKQVPSTITDSYKDQIAQARSAAAGENAEQGK